MVKISTTVAEDGALTISISGRLTPDGCEAVDQILKDARERQQQVQIDLADIRLLDRPSVEYLAHIRSRAIALINVPPYLIRWIEEIS